MAGRKSMATMELAIGASIIAGILILIVMLMAWGNATSFLGRHYRVIVNMTNVGGLKEGAPVKMGGFQIGSVASIQIRPGSTEMEIVLDIDESRWIPKDSTAKVSTAGLVGDAFLEVVPGKSTEPVTRSATVAGAAHLQSSPLPDLSEILTKVNAFGDQLTVLTANINDVIGDAAFRKSLKSTMVNLDNVSHQANLILQRGQNVVDNIELASQNIVSLTTALHTSVGEVTANIERITGSAVEVADSAKATVSKANAAIDNIDGGVTDVRKAINATIGDPKIASDLAQAVANINSISALLARRNDAINEFILNVNATMADFKTIAGHVKEITGSIEPSVVADTLGHMNMAIASMTGVVDQIKSEPVLALSINKAADRIVKMKFDEMSRQAQYKTPDQALQEINRWVRENMNQGYFADPAYPREARPYAMPGAAKPPANATSRTPYLLDR